MMRRFVCWAARIFAKPHASELLIEPAPEALAAWRVLLGAKPKSPDS
jgi:hypothetical protein